MPSPRPVAVFDIGNVLLRWDPRHLYRQVFADEARVEWFLTHVCDSDWNREQDRGRPWEEAVAEATARHPTFADAIRAYDLRWADTVAGAIEENVALLARLRAAGEKVFAITNFSAPKFALAREAYPFLAAFDGVVVSGEERLLKPDPLIYRLLLDRYGLDAGACVFIDDSPANVEGARAVGMRAIHYREGVDLAEALAAHGIAAARPAPSTLS